MSSGSTHAEVQAPLPLLAAVGTPGTPTGQRCSPFGLRRRGAKHPGRARTTPHRERQPSLSRSPHASATQTLPRSRSSLKALLCAGVNLGNRAPKAAAWFCLRLGWRGRQQARLVWTEAQHQQLHHLCPCPHGQVAVRGGSRATISGYACQFRATHVWVLSSQSTRPHLLSASGRARYLFPRSGGLHLNFNPLVLDKRFFYSKYFIVAH